MRLHSSVVQLLDSNEVDPGSIPLYGGLFFSFFFNFISEHPVSFMILLLAVLFAILSPYKIQIKWEKSLVCKQTCIILDL